MVHPDNVHGLLIVDKPLHWTSHDVVGLVRRAAKQRGVGHAGTLDPLATGVLVLLLGDATRLSSYVMRSRKCYRATIRLGVTTTTDDREGDVLSTNSVPSFSSQDVVSVLHRFCGAITQVPPAYAAIKTEGIAAYKKARRGEAFELPARPVRIDGIALEERNAEELTVFVWCAEGTYIRALARDIGAALGCGGHLASLRRLRSGRFAVDDAWSVETIRDRGCKNTLHELVVPLDAGVTGLPAVIVGSDDATNLRHGRPLPKPDTLAPPFPEEALAVSQTGRLLALMKYDDQRAMWQPHRVFAHASEPTTVDAK